MSIQEQFDQLERLFSENKAQVETHVQNLSNINQTLHQLEHQYEFTQINNNLNQLLTAFMNKLDIDEKQDSLTELRNSIGDSSRAIYLHQIIDAIQDLPISEEYLLQLNRTIQVLRE